MKDQFIDGVVSVIMPAYNAEKYLAESITSVLNQTYTKIELIIIDDCSTDKTPLLVKDFINKDQRIKMIANLHNSGPGISRNNGIKIARGRYIAFLDSDDIWPSEKLNKQVFLMNNKKSGFSFTQARRFRSSVKDVGILIDIPDFLDYEGLLKNSAIMTSSVVLDRKIIGEISLVNVSKRYIEDYILFYRILKKGFNALGLKHDLLRYRVADNSFSRNKITAALRVWRTYLEVEKLSLRQTIYYFCNYVFRALIKYTRF